MKLTAQRKGNALTTSLVPAFDRARWYRQRMRAAALRFRRWSATPCHSYAEEALNAAVDLRARALFHENPNGL